jgi:carbon storage regulator CsrA
MLVLDRKKEQTIHIDGGIVVKVIRTGRTSCKIGIKAPSGTRVIRGELREQEVAGGDEK